MVKGTYVDKNGVRKGAWTQQEDDKLRVYVQRYGHWNWRLLPKFAGLDRCGKSCRLRWMNYLKPGVRRGGYTQEERDLIAKLHHQHGNKWSVMAEKLPGRTDNGIKNYWHAHLKNRQKTTSKIEEKAELCKQLSDGFSDSNKVTCASPKLCSRKHIKTRVSSSDHPFVLESSESNSAVVPTVVELGSDSSMEYSCSNISSITSRLTEDVPNFSDLLVSGFDDSFWTQPFMVETNSYHGYDFRVCDEEGIFSPFFYKWLNAANYML